MPYKDPEKQKAYYKEYYSRPEVVARVRAYEDARRGKRNDYHSARNKERYQDPEYAEAAKRRVKRWYHANKDRAKKRIYQWAKDNAARVQANHREWQDKNRDKMREIMKRHYAASPGRYRNYAREAEFRRRTREKQGRVGRADYQLVILMSNGNCGICAKEVAREDLSYDHIIPISKGGAHSLENLQLAHVYCNKRKAGMMPDEITEAVLRRWGV